MALIVGGVNGGVCSLLGPYCAATTPDDVTVLLFAVSAPVGVRW